MPSYTNTTDTSNEPRSFTICPAMRLMQSFQPIFSGFLGFF
jgi:hypothetical protein